MTDNTDKLMAEALVQCGYADGISEDGRIYHIENWYPYMSKEKARAHEDVAPFADTLAGRRQADALEDYFEQRPALWGLWNSFPRPYVYDVGETMREWRLDRVKWCFKQLAEQS